MNDFLCINTCNIGDMRILKMICYLQFKFNAVSCILSDHPIGNVNLQNLALLLVCIFFPPGSDFVLVSLKHAGIAGF